MKLFGSIRKKKEQMVREANHTPDNPKKDTDSCCIAFDPKKDTFCLRYGLWDPESVEEDFTTLEELEETEPLTENTESTEETTTKEATEPVEVPENMVTPMEIDEFREHGFLILVNTILHTYGVCLSFNPNKPEDGLRPGFCKFRGFPEASMERMYIALSEYMKENSERLVEESKL